MMKLVSILGLAGAAAAASSSAAANHQPIHRFLDGEDEGDNAAGDLSGYSLQYSTCIKTKIASDDDAVEGNSMYVNGAYRAQYNLYATYRLCQDNGNGQCTCDKSVEYATELENFLTSSLEYLGDAGGGGETNFLECAYGGQENGVNYYLGPQCSDTGGLVIGTFYDEDCTVKASYSAPSFNYYTFSSIQSACRDCADGGCEDLVNDSHQCVNGKDIAGEDNVGVCSAAKRATAEVDYSRVKKRNSGAILFAKVFIAMLVIGLVGGFMFLAYTYFLRHKGDRNEHLVESVPVGAALT
jgi:hypothetical protein